MASGVDEDGYVNLTLGERRSVFGSDVLVRQGVAGPIIAEQQAREGAAASADLGGQDEPGLGPEAPGSGAMAPTDAPVAPVEALPQSFYLDVELDPVGGVRTLGGILDEVVDPLRAAGGTTVRLHLSLSAENPGGFDAGAQRTVRENCATLGHRGEFED